MGRVGRHINRLQAIFFNDFRHRYSKRLRHKRPPILSVAYQKNTYYFIYEIMPYKYGGKFLRRHVPRLVYPTYNENLLTQGLPHPLP